MGTFIYKFVVTILNPLPTNEYTLKNSYTFVDKIKQLSFNKEVQLAIFYVRDLFTNIPLHEIIDICIQQLLTQNSLDEGLDANQFRSLLEIATKDTLFLFNNAYYQQVDGVAMGSPLGPKLTNSLCHHQTNWLKNFPIDFVSLHSYRYVDDFYILS